MTSLRTELPTVTAPDTAAFPDILAQIAVGAVERESGNVNPFEQVKLLAHAGYGKLRIPAERGGVGLSVREFFAAIIDLAAADPTVAHIYRAHFGFTEEFLAQRTPSNDRFLGLIAQGKVFGNASAERSGRAAGDVELNTRLTPERDHFILNGEKFYTTGTLFSDYVYVATVRGDDRVSVIIPTDRDGVHVIDDWDGFGQRRTGSGTTRFTDVKVYTEDIQRVLPLGKVQPLSTQGPFFQLYLHAVIAGILRTVVTDAKALVGGRNRNFSHASAPVPAEDPLLQQVVGELASLAFVSEATVLIAAEAISTANNSAIDGIPDHALAEEAALATSKAKVVLDEIGVRAATLLFEAGGASASSRSTNLDRHWRNIRTITLHNPARNKAQAIGANVLLNQPLPTNGYF